MPIISTRIDSGRIKGVLCGNQRVSVFKGIPLCCSWEQQSIPAAGISETLVWRASL